MGWLVRGLVVCLVCAAGSGQAEEQWALAKNEDGIKVYLRSVSGSNYQAYRGVTRINAQMAVIRRLQEDVVGACDWVHECKEQKLLKHEGTQAWTYTRFNTPWPVTPRDSVLRITTQKTNGGGLRRELKGEPDYLPEEEGYVRVGQVEGFWLLEPVADGVVEVTYEVHTEPGGNVPSWLANKFVVEAPYNTLFELRERAEQR